jgi:uncharacterized protein (DUF362 family)
MANESFDHWPGTPDALDSALLSVLETESAFVVDTSSSSNPFQFVTDILPGFVEQHYRGGSVVVKTSTAGNRSVAHEVSQSLLTRVLRIAIDLVPPKSVLLADGPAYASYQDECRRLGWNRIAQELAVGVGDLNIGEIIEIRPGWPVSANYLRADLVINLTKAKTHRRFGVSLAEKSLLGALSAEKSGQPKLVARHRYVPWFLKELQRRSPPIFSIIDGMNAIEGEGPLAGSITDSHFISFGVGCLAPDLRAIVEMGFDPVLVPLLCRPFGIPAPKVVPRWSDLRVTSVDFRPPASCSWLYRSLDRSIRRTARYKRLLEGARKSWPPEEVTG